MISPVTLLSGAVAGWVSSMMFYPLETIEARQQVDTRLGSRKLFSALSFVLKTEGLPGAYVGWQGGVCGNAFNWAMYFSLYQAMMMAVSGGQGQASLSTLMQLFVGIVTGCIACTLVNPFWVVKYRMVRHHAQNPTALAKGSPYSTFAGTVKAIAEDEGVGQLWSGVKPSCFGSLCGAIQFLLHSEFKRTAFVSSSTGFALTLLIFASGCLSSFIATALTYPYQVVRGRVQAAKGEVKGGIVQLIQNQYKNEGLGSFYCGLDTNLTRQIPTSGSMLVVQEVTAWLIRAVFPNA